MRARRAEEVVGLEQDRDAVTVRVQGDSGTYEVTAAYVVGCDGGHSRVRELAGIGFPGVTDSTVISRSAEVILPGSTVLPDKAQVEVPGVGKLGLYAWHRTTRGAYAILPQPSGALLISAMEWDEPDSASDVDVPMSLEELTSAVQRVLGVDLATSEPPAPGPPKSTIDSREIGGSLSRWCSVALGSPCLVSIRCLRYSASRSLAEVSVRNQVIEAGRH